LALVMAVTASVPGAASSVTSTTSNTTPLSPRHTTPLSQCPLLREKQDTASRRRASRVAPKQRRIRAATKPSSVDAICSGVGGAVNDRKGVVHSTRPAIGGAVDAPPCVAAAMGSTPKARSSADIGAGAGSARPIELPMLLDFSGAAQRSSRSLLCLARGWSPSCESRPSAELSASHERWTGGARIGAREFVSPKPSPGTVTEQPSAEYRRIIGTKAAGDCVRGSTATGGEALMKLETIRAVQPAW
jgi:hypothetical protein